MNSSLKELGPKQKIEKERKGALVDYIMCIYHLEEWNFSYFSCILMQS